MSILSAIAPTALPGIDLGAIITALTGHASVGGAAGAIALDGLSAIAGTAVAHAIQGQPVSIPGLSLPSVAVQPSGPAVTIGTPTANAPKTIGLSDLAKIGMTPTQAQAMGYTVV